MTDIAPDKRGYLGQFKDNFSYFSTKTCYDPSLELSQRDDSALMTGYNIHLKEYGKLTLNHSLYLFIWSTDRSVLFANSTVFIFGIIVSHSLITIQ